MAEEKRRSRLYTLNPFSEDVEMQQLNYRRERAATMTEEQAHQHDIDLLASTLATCYGCGDTCGVRAEESGSGRIDHRCVLCGQHRVVQYPGDRVYVHKADLVFQELHSSVTAEAEDMLPEPEREKSVSCCLLT